jgi:hypothetical protein
MEIRDSGKSESKRTRRTSHQQSANENAANLMQAWRADAMPSTQLELGEDGATCIPSSGRADEVIYIGAGQPLGFSLDETSKYLELDADFGHAYQPRTAMLARAARDVVSATTGRTLKDVALKAILHLDDASGNATPMWCIRFDAMKLAPEAMKAIEPNLRALFDLATAASVSLWKTADGKLVPGSAVAAQIVKAAKELRRVAAGKAITPNCQVTFRHFGQDIKLAATIGTGPSEDARRKTLEAIGEVVGYNRDARVLHLLQRGHQVASDLGIDTAVFQDLVENVSRVLGNECRICYREEREGGRVVRTEVRKLMVNPDLFAQLPDFDSAEVEAEPAEA